MSSLFILIFGFIFQIAIYRFFAFRGIALNLMLILTVELALVKGRDRGAVFGFSSGLAEDLFFSGLIGERAFIRTIIGYISGSLKGKFSARSIVFQFFIIISAHIFQAFGIVLIRAIFSFPQISLRYLAAAAFIGGVIAPLVYFIVERTDAG